MSARIAIPTDGIAAFCERWQVTELALFDMVHMEEELKALFGREVDLVSRRGIEQGRNHLRRRAILESVETIYAA